MFSVVVHLVELVSNHILRWIGLKLVTMWIAQKCISVNARIHIQSGLKLVRNCRVNRPLALDRLLDEESLVVTRHLFIVAVYASTC